MSITTKSKKADKLTDEPIYFRPFETDAREIEKRVRSSGKKQPDLIREIIRAGLYHLRLTEARQDPTHQFAKMKTVEAMREGLKPTNNQLDNVLSKLGVLEEKLDHSLQLSRQQDRRSAASANQVIEKLDEQHKNLGEIFRQVLVQRGLFYIYLLAYRAGTISERRDIPEKQWIEFVNQSSNLTSQMVADELLNARWQEIEKHYIPNLARDIFELVRASRSNE